MHSNTLSVVKKNYLMQILHTTRYILCTLIFNLYTKICNLMLHNSTLQASLNPKLNFEMPHKLLT